MSTSPTGSLSRMQSMTQTSMPDYFEVINAKGSGPIVLVCEHASNAVPDEFTTPLPDKQNLNEHIAWDPGAKALAQLLSQSFNAPLVCSRVSRLIYDCNRPPESASAIPEKSERFEIPGNQNLDNDERQARINRIYRPFHQTLADVITAKQAAGLEPALVTVHSFTPYYFDQVRKTQIGVLHDSDSKMADGMLTIAPKVCQLLVERNKPYGPDDGVTHTLIKHGIARSLPNVMLEIKNDLLTTAMEIKTMADIIQAMIKHSLKTTVTVT